MVEKAGGAGVSFILLRVNDFHNNYLDKLSRIFSTVSLRLWIV